MNIAWTSADPIASTADLLVFGVATDGKAGFGKRTPGFDAVDKALGGALRAAAKDERFEGKPRQRLVMPTLGKIRPGRVALVGLGEIEGTAATPLFWLGGQAARLAKDVAAKSLDLVLPELGARDVGHTAALVARGLSLGLYQFTLYLSDKGRKPALQKVGVVGPKLAPKEAKEAIAQGSAVAEGVALARDLVNTSPLELYPETFAKRMAVMAKAQGLKCKILEPAELKRRGMNLLLGVGAGSARPPRLLHLAYEPAAGKGKGKGKTAPLVLVGKGMTYDSGGLSLKTPTTVMAGMKMDMAGAAAVVGTMLAVAKLRPKVPVHGVCALAENMPSGTAIRPDDVIQSASGKYVEVNNTDAEGRLVLADALHYAREDIGAGRIIDLATLTGACIIALGPHTVGLFSNHDDMASEVLEAASRQGEDFWRMPVTRALREQLNSDVADIKNTGGREGGAITAALFLQEFVGDVPWTHLDIAGPAVTTWDFGPYQKGATGVGVATLVDLVRKAG